MSNVHICRAFMCQPGEVFVWDVDYPRGWLRVAQSAVTDDSEIIRCADCREPAIYLDYFAPYHTERNRCANCAWAEGIITREERDEYLSKGDTS